MSKLITWLIRSTSRPRAATSVATRISIFFAFSWSTVRSLWLCWMSPLSGAAEKSERDQLFGYLDGLDFGAHEHQDTVNVFGFYDT